MTYAIILQGGNSGGLIANYGLLILLMVVIWLFFFRPQAKKQKAQKTFIDEIEKGDDVATSSGMIGKINKVEDDVITLQVDTKTFIKVTRSSISKELTEAVQKSKE